MIQLQRPTHNKMIKQLSAYLVILILLDFHYRYQIMLGVYEETKGGDNIVPSL